MWLEKIVSTSAIVQEYLSLDYTLSNWHWIPDKSAGVPANSSPWVGPLLCPWTVLMDGHWLCRPVGRLDISLSLADGHWKQFSLLWLPCKAPKPGMAIHRAYLNVTDQRCSCELMLVSSVWIKLFLFVSLGFRLASSYDLKEPPASGQSGWWELFGLVPFSASVVNLGMSPPRSEWAEWACGNWHAPGCSRV